MNTFCNKTVKAQVQSLDISEQQKRNTLIQDHLYLVKHIVGKLEYLAFSETLTEDDLVSYGTIGLIEAIDKYDVSKGSLKSFAYLRIKGAILDHVRSIDHLKRTSRKKVKQLHVAVQELEQKLGQAPSNTQIAEALGVSLTELHKTQRDTAINFLSINATLDESGDEFSSIIPSKEATPEDNCERSLMLENLEQAIKVLPEKEKLIIGMYHFKQLSMRKISKILGISESRVCQLHNKAISLLRTNLVKN